MRMQYYPTVTTYKTASHSKSVIDHYHGLPAKTARRMNAGNRGQTLEELIQELRNDETRQREIRSRDPRSNPNFERWFYEAQQSSRVVDERTKVAAFNIKVSHFKKFFINLYLVSTIDLLSSKQ